MSIAALELETMLLQRPSPGVAVLTLNRPDRLNAMTKLMFAELMAVPRALADDDALRVLVITGAGRAFCAGYDLDQIAEITEMGVRDFLKFEELASGGLSAIRALRVPVIAAVNGPAAGGGLALALCADMRFAAPEAKFSAAFVKVGLSFGELGVSWTLPRLVGPGLAAEMAYTGRNVEAVEAAQIGLINRVIASDKLIPEVMDLAAQIAANAPGGVQLSKRALQASLDVGYASAVELENRGQSLLTRGHDMREALEALRTRRLPHFTGA